MYYTINDYPSAVTEERLAGIVCGAVKDYLSEQSEHVRHCHETIEEQQETIKEQQETIEEQQETIDTLQQQVAELMECLNAIYTGKVSSVTNHYNGCEVTQHYQSGQTQIVNPTFGAMYDVHGNGKVSCGN
jgi:uncharacterized coiled-coil protein SlyX